MKQLWLPRAPPPPSPCPNNDGLVFGAARHNIYARDDGRSPRHVPYPVGVSGSGSQRPRLFLPLAILGRPRPEADSVVAPPRDDSGLGCRRHPLTLPSTGLVEGRVRCPADSVYAEAVVPDVLHAPGVVLVVRQDTDAPVRAGSGGNQTELVRGECHPIDGRIVQSACSMKEGPLPGTGFTMDEDRSVKGARGEDNAEFRVGPRHLPNGSLVTLEGGSVSERVAGNIVDLDGSV
mmetsp:Transcript_34046/g.63034  ORF Transcript_34046/g.63034 Transcript_34046/m.63034 type:complete len:234 (-) Transcript_34046:190-891(-)